MEGEVEGELFAPPSSNTQGLTKLARKGGREGGREGGKEGGKEGGREGRRTSIVGAPGSKADDGDEGNERP